MRWLSQFATVLLIVAATQFARAAEVAVLANGFEIRHQRREVSGDNTRLYLSSSPESGYVDVPTGDIAEFRHEDDPPAPPQGAAQRANDGRVGDLAEQAKAATPMAQGKTVTASAAQVQALANAAGNRHLIDPDLIASVIRAESNFNPNARSRKGAQGLMQLMPETASALGVDDPYAPEANVDAGTRYLRNLLLQYNADLAKALAAYNAGPRRVDQYGGVPPYRETHAYVARIIRDFNRKKLEQDKALREKPAQPQQAKARLAGDPVQEQAKPAVAPAKPASTKTTATVKTVRKSTKAKTAPHSSTDPVPGG